MEEIRKKKKKGFKIWYRSRRKILRPVALLLFVIGVFVLIRILISQTEIFTVQHFEIFEVDRAQLTKVDLEKIDLVIKEYIKGKNFFDLDVNDLEAVLTQEDPFIKKAYVEKVFPGGILIEIEEKAPYMVYDHVDGCLLFDEDNSLVTIIEVGDTCEEAAEIFQVLLVRSAEYYEVLDEVEKKIRGFETLYRLENMLYANDVYVTKVDIETSKMVLTDKIGRSYIFNHESNVSVQMKRCVLVLGQIDFDKIIYKELDFRYERPVLRD